jgi:hypothetical protein
MQGLLIEAKIVDTEKEVIEIVSLYSASSLQCSDEVLANRTNFKYKQFRRIKYDYDDCKFTFFLEEENKEMIKLFLEDSIQGAMSKTGYENARRFRQIEEGYGKEFSEMLVKKAKDPVVRQQLMRALDF